MNLFSYPFLADENIHPNVVKKLRQQEINISSVIDEGLAGLPDNVILQFAHQSGKVVLTHDSDFGTLSIAQQQSFIGIVFLRPGHIQPQFTLDTLESLKNKNIDVSPSFIVVATRQQNMVRIRVRQF